MLIYIRALSGAIRNFNLAGNVVAEERDHRLLSKKRFFDIEVGVVKV